MNDYGYLRQQYPAVVTMEQLYRICHISKRRARWLLEQGIIPCQDSGKQTRRFQIRLNDVIEYLRQQDAGELSAAPKGIFNSTKPISSSRQYLDYDELAAHILAAWSDAPDALSTAQAAELCGYCAATICAWRQKGILQGVIYHGKLLLSKDSLAQRLSSRPGQSIHPKSPQHQALLDEYRQRMELGETEDYSPRLEM